MDKLLLLSGNDIPFPAATINIHQLRLNEISFLTEPIFYKACGVLTFDKEKIYTKDKNDLEGLTNFDIIMSIMTEKNDPRVKQQQVSVKMLFAMLFPDYKITFTKNGIVLVKDGDKEMHIIRPEDFQEFTNIIKEIFCLSSSSQEDYNPANDKAREIAEKLRRGRAAAAAAKGEDQTEISILSRYVSILAVGNHKDINALMNYTVYQLYDEFGRYELKLSNDIYIQAKMAGAEGLKEVDNWMKDIHS